MAPSAPAAAAPAPRLPSPRPGQTPAYGRRRASKQICSGRPGSYRKGRRILGDDRIEQLDDIGDVLTELRSLRLEGIGAKRIGEAL